MGKKKKKNTYNLLTGRVAIMQEYSSQGICIEVSSFWFGFGLIFKRLNQREKIDVHTTPVTGLVIPKKELSH